MLGIYLGALAFGGTLLLASLVLGQKDADGGDSVDGDPDPAGVDPGAPVGVGGIDWLPVTSLRFWTFFLAFGGATGSALTQLTELGAGPVGGASFAVGWLSGLGMVEAMRTLRRGSVGSEVSTRDLRGEVAEVLIPVARGEVGKVRVVAKGRIHDFIAETDDDGGYVAGDKVMILGEGAEGRVQVTRGAP
jgi:membrane protein implicated in regulation of membrane protease activity